MIESQENTAQYNILKLKYKINYIQFETMNFKQKFLQTKKSK